MRKSLGFAFFTLLAGYAPRAAAQDPQTSPAPYLVFFDSGETSIDADAAAILDKAAAAYQQVRGTSVAVIGHTDRAGSSRANRFTSQRRADAVREYLAARGVPIRSIATTAAGETEPLVPTADGVREPQNRRVEVRLAAPAAAK